MRIAQIIDTLDLLGGAQKMQVVLAQMVQDMDVDLTVLVLEDRSRGTKLPNMLKALNVDVHHYPAPKLLNLPRAWKLYKFLRQGNFDLVHTNLTHANIVGVFVAWLAGIPAVAGIRNAFYVQHRFYAIRSMLESFTLNVMADGIMAVGKATAEAQQARFPEKPIVAIPSSVALPKPISAEERIRSRAVLASNLDQPVIITVGNLIEQKGFADLIDGFSIVQQTYPEAQLAIVGDGELKEELQAQIESLELTDKVKLVGRREDVTNLLAASDIFVSSSHWEGLSNAILEAMAAGLPMVATAVADTPNVVVHGTGLLVPPKRPTALAKAISTLLANPDMQRDLGKHAKLHVAQHHNPFQWAGQMLNLYRTILQNGDIKHSKFLAVERSKS